MASSVGTSAGDTFCDINTTPLIDVMLVLLVTLIVTLPIMTHAVKLDMPNVTNPPPPPPTPPELIELEIDVDGTVVWTGTAVPRPHARESFLHVEWNEAPQPNSHLRPDRPARSDMLPG